MEVGVAYRADGKPFVQLVAWNQINNRMQVVLSADAVERHGGLKEVMLDLCQALHEQAKVDYPWQGRKRFLELLKELQRLDPGSSWVIQMGDAKFPQVHDIQSHRMIDQIAAPLIGLFGQLSHNGGVTDSYVNSPAEREIEIVLGESYQRYALALQIKDSTLRHVSVVPRIDIPSGELVLAWNQARKFRVQVADVKDRGQETLQKLVQHFASLVTSLPGRPAQQFRTSQLRKLLKRLSA
jgi:hypothetical protein